MLIANHVIGTYGFQEMIVTTFRLKTFVLTLIFTIIMAIPPALSQEHSKHGGHGAHSHGKGITLPEGPEAPSVSINITKDKVGGWNLHAQTQNFRFAPEHASGKHIAGEGHAHIYVNGKNIARLYSAWFHIGKLPAEGAEIRVTLNANDHRDLIVGGKPVAATIMVGQINKVHVHN